MRALSLSLLCSFPRLIKRWFGRANGLIVFFRVLIKPVLERSLRSMLNLASERLAASTAENGEPS